MIRSCNAYVLAGMLTPLNSLFQVFLRLLASLLLVALPVWAQENGLSESDAKAHYTLEIIKHIEWPSEAEFPQFRAAIIGADTKLRQAFEQKNGASIRGKVVVFDYIDDVRSLMSFNHS